MLVAGQTGTGKSVCLNAIICSILTTHKAQDVRLALIDPKVVELSIYRDVPHLLEKPFTDCREAAMFLDWAVCDMEERYAVLAGNRKRSISEYRADGGEMPYVIIVIDELADLMLTSRKLVEKHIVRLAQKSRAVGIHLIVATQKPVVTVVTGLIKSNLPARLSFQVASKTDSRVVLDCNGAEALLGCGDFLFRDPRGGMSRGQGAWIDSDEINDIIGKISV
jgi:S-DNA-T family DNA segregation ATPase FtsK/SpoIIIE